MHTGAPGLKSIYGIASNATSEANTGVRYDHEPAQRGAKPAENPEALRLVRQHSTTLLAIGEIFSTVWDYPQIIREQLIDHVRSAVTHTGGITHLKKVLEYASQYQIKSGMHGPTDVSPVGMAAAMHLGLAIHSFGIQENMKHGARTDAVFQQSFTFTDGYLHPGGEPGLGVDLDADEAGRYPYEVAYLPYNRLADGTVHDWWGLPRDGPVPTASPTATAPSVPACAAGRVASPAGPTPAATAARARGAKGPTVAAGPVASRPGSS